MDFDDDDDSPEAANRLRESIEALNTEITLATNDKKHRTLAAKFQHFTDCKLILDLIGNGASPSHENVYEFAVPVKDPHVLHVFVEYCRLKSKPDFAPPLRRRIVEMVSASESETVGFVTRFLGRDMEFMFETLHACDFLGNDAFANFVCACIAEKLVERSTTERGLGALKITKNLVRIVG